MPLKGYWNFRIYRSNWRMRMDWKELENVIEEGKGETNYVEAMELGGGGTSFN